METGRNRLSKMNTAILVQTSSGTTLTTMVGPVATGVLGTPIPTVAETLGET